MQSFHAMKTGTKLAGGFGLLVALLLAVTAVTIWRIQSINTEVAEILDDRAVKVAIATDIDQAINVQARALRNMIIGHKDAEEVRASLDRIQKTSADITALLTKLQPMLNTEAGRQAYKTIVDTRVAYAKGRDEVVALIQAGKVDEAGVSLLKTQRPAQTAYLEAVEGFSVSQAKLMTQAGETAEADGLAAVRTTVGLSLLATLLAAAVAYAITRSITRQLGGEPAEAAEIAATIAQGDLSRPVPVEAGDTTSLLANLSAMQASLVRVVSEVRQNSESVATASAQIAQGNQDLSGRTEEQASALQQTAATMEQLGTTVRHNADNARQANQLAQGASTVAARGGEVVGRVVTTMQGINDSSRKIGDIISVIDGIAFQTNILALNAAVEAARAGEQGRGFAVVAGEVRTLAQRSAEAAKEIKTLIGRSVEQVEQGTALVDQAGKTMGEIVESIRRVSDIVAEISAASAEQSSGVQQVGDAVGQMDQATQQNAALVEESAAAAESLKTQAQSLVQVVAVFKVSHASPAAHVAPAPAAANAPVLERRGPNRAKNVARPAFRAKAASAPAAAPATIVAATPAKTGTDDWETF